MPFRIFVDLQAAQSLDSGRRGLGRYAVELTSALVRNGAPIDFVGLNPLLPKPELPLEIESGARVVDITTRSLDQACSTGPIAYHVMSPMQAPYDIDLVLPRAIERADAMVMVAYDLIPFLFADPYLMRDSSVHHHVGRLRRVKTADLLLAISERTRLDFIEHLGVDPDRIVNIGTGVSEFFTPAKPDTDPHSVASMAVPGITRPFIMSVPAFEWRKNADGLIRAFARTRARRETQLVIACAVPPHGEQVWRHLIHEVGLSDEDVVITGYIPDTTLRALYRATSLFVFPSRYEGFGLPVAEAARCGAACITSDRGSLNEVLGLPKSTFDPDDVDGMAALIDRALDDDDLRRELLAASARSVAVHTWDATAQRAIRAYERLDPPSPRHRPRQRKPLVAVVGPMLPVASGVAVYTERVLDELDADLFDVDVYAESVPIGKWPPPVKARRLFPAAALGVNSNPFDYDAIVYTIGTSRVHIETLERARRFPGIVWLHDVNLVGLMLEWAERLHFEGRMGWRGDRRDDTVAGILGAELQARYGDAYRADLFADAPPYDDAITRGPLFAVSAVHAARAVIVHSAHARELLLRDLALSGAEAPPITVVPHAFPSVTPRDPGDRNPDPTVVSFGFCAARKAPELLVEAMAGLSAPARLVFAGSCTDESRERIQETADALGIADRVHITGYLPEADYQAWLRRAWCAVQLRRVDFGESTGTVHDAMAAGLPVVTNIASCRELPPGAIVAVDLDPDALATHLDRVLFDEPTASELSRRAQAHAASWTFTDVAGRLRELIVESVPKGSRPFVRAR